MFSNRISFRVCSPAVNILVLATWQTFVAHVISIPGAVSCGVREQCRQLQHSSSHPQGNKDLIH